MSVQTITIQMPQTLYQRLERIAYLTRRPLDKLITQALESNLPPLPDNLPAATRDALMTLENLNDDALWQIARSGIEPHQHAHYSLLLEKNTAGTLTTIERELLTHLREEADMLMLRKAYAYVLLKWRGHRLPSLAELEGQV